MSIDNAADTDLFSEAFRDALGQVLAEQRQQWKREREFIKSEALQVVAELRATIAQLASEIYQKAITPGPPEPPGPPGSPGTLPLAKTWEPGQVFYAGDVVVHGGATYQCLRDTARSVIHTEDWICLARAGRNGSDGTPNVCGTYNAHASYERLDIIAAPVSLLCAMIPEFVRVLVGS